MDLLVVSVGTDHHPFDRLVGWVEQWRASRPDVRVVLQHGTSRPGVGCENHEMLPHHELMELFEQADAVVLQGGPGGIMDARAHGITPIVVPRNPELGEHVDGHQMDFSRYISSAGKAEVVSMKQELHRLLSETERGRRTWRIDRRSAMPAGVRAVAQHLSSPPELAVGRMRKLWRIWAPS